MINIELIVKQNQYNLTFDCFSDISVSKKRNANSRNAIFKITFDIAKIWLRIVQSQFAH